MFSQRFVLSIQLERERSIIRCPLIVVLDDLTGGGGGGEETVGSSEQLQPKMINFGRFVIRDTFHRLISMLYVSQKRHER